MRLKRVLLALTVSLTSAAVVTTVVVPTTAQAKKRRKARKAKRRGKSVEKASKETAEAKKAQKQAEERKAPARFDWTERSADVDMDLRADRARDEAILKLKKLLPEVAEGEQKAELVFRLSEMYWSKAKYKHLRAMQIWDEQLETWHEAGEKGPQPKLEKIPETGEADLYKREALVLYGKILESYPRYPRKDEVLYNLGSSHYESGDKKKGVEMYWKLIKQYPQSEYAADSWLQLGEHFFNTNKLTQAIKAYSKAAETKKPRIYSFALYKLAWCDYNLGEYPTALEKFRQVVSYADSARAKARTGDGDMQQRDRIQLKEEALSDMVRTYSHLDAVDDAFDYYTEQVGKEAAYKYLHKLAKAYDGEGKWDTEILTYQKLNEMYPYAPQAPQNHTAIMSAYAQLGKNDMVRQETRRLIDLYSPTATWAKKNADNQDVLDQAFDAVEQELASLVTEQHRAAQTTKLSDTYLLARDLYKEYLDTFTDTPNAYKFRFFYAEILFELKEYEAAAPVYDRVVDSNAKGEFAKHAAYASILSWEKVVAGVKETVGKKISEGRRGKQKGTLEKLEKIDKLEKGKSYEPTDLTAAEKKLAAACDRFVEVAPKDDEVVKVKFKSGQLYYKHNQFEPAAERFGEIIDKWPKHEFARVSAELIVQSFNVREDWSNLNKWARTFRKNKGLMSDRTFAKTIGDFIEGATFNEVHYVFEPKESDKQIADRYTEFVIEFPQSKYALVALYNATVNYDKANLLENAIDRAEKILKDYKNFKLKKDDLEQSKKDGAALPEPDDIREKTMFLAASFYERLAQFETSADLYEQYAKEFKKGPKRADALYNAGIFREGLGQLDAALKNFSAYIKEYSGKEDVPVVAWRIGLILEKKKDYRAALGHFGSFGKYARGDASRQLCADFKVVQALHALQKDREAKAAYDGLVKGYKKLSDEDKQKPCPLEAVATVAFNVLDPEFEAYKAIPLSGVREKEMEKNLLRKLALVDELQKKYTEVLAIGQGDYGIASLYRIGLIYQHMAKEIFGMPCPKKLTEDQCMMYQAAVQEKAFPLEEKAIEAFDKTLAKAYELGLYNDWLAKAQDALKGYEPGRFPEVHTYDLIASEATFEVPTLVELQQ